MVKVKINEKEIEISNKTTYYDLSKTLDTDKVPYLVKINRDVKELRRIPKNGEDIQFLYYKDQMARDAYARTAILIMLKAIHDVYKDADAALKFKVQNAYYFEIKGRTIDANGARLIIDQYAEIVKSETPIKKVEYSKIEASKLLAQIYISAKDYENAKNVIKTAITQSPTNSDLYYYLAKTEPNNKLFQIENLKKALENQKTLTINADQIKQELKDLRK